MSRQDLGNIFSNSKGRIVLRVLFVCQASERIRGLVAHETTTFSRLVRIGCFSFFLRVRVNVQVITVVMGINERLASLSRRSACVFSRIDSLEGRLVWDEISILVELLLKIGARKELIARPTSVAATRNVATPKHVLHCLPHVVNIRLPLLGRSYCARKLPTVLVQNAGKVLLRLC